MNNKSVYVAPDMELFSVRAEERFTAATCEVRKNFDSTWEGSSSECSIWQGYYTDNNEAAGGSL